MKDLTENKVKEKEDIKNELNLSERNYHVENLRNAVEKSYEIKLMQPHGNLKFTQEELDEGKFAAKFRKNLKAP